MILAYLLITVGLGLYIGLRMKTGADVFLAGRRLPWWAIGLSLVPTDIGGTDIISVVGAAYAHGIVPLFYRSGVYTVPEFLERPYNMGVRTVLAASWKVPRCRRRLPERPRTGHRSAIGRGVLLI